MLLPPFLTSLKNIMLWNSCFGKQIRLSTAYEGQLDFKLEDIHINYSNWDTSYAVISTVATPNVTYEVLLIDLVVNYHPETVVAGIPDHQ